MSWRFKTNDFFQNKNCRWVLFLGRAGALNKYFLVGLNKMITTHRKGRTHCDDSCDFYDNYDLMETRLKPHGQMLPRWYLTYNGIQGQFRFLFVNLLMQCLVFLVLKLRCLIFLLMLLWVCSHAPGNRTRDLRFISPMHALRTKLLGRTSSR